MRILVTGASRGIGKEIASQVKGDVYASARNEELLRSYANYCAADLSTFEGMKKLGDYIEENEIDVLVNNAGEYIYSNVEDIKYPELENLIRLNLEAPLYLISRAVPYMKKKKFGRIINIGSISGVMGEAGASIYSAAKAGLIGSAKALALELAEFGITVNTINPGWVDTELGRESIDESEFSREEVLSCIPQKRFVSPYEIAGMVNYLISDAAKGVTGQSVNICAGLSVGY